MLRVLFAKLKSALEQNYCPPERRQVGLRGDVAGSVYVRSSVGLSLHQAYVFRRRLQLGLTGGPPKSVLWVCFEKCTTTSCRAQVLSLFSEGAAKEYNV